MNTEERIAQANNPQEFVRLCNSLLLAEYGHEYQAVDGTRGDNGNDGYVAREERLLAIYCPVKPEQRADRDFIRKIRSDLKKAAGLRDQRVMKLTKWTFVTPRKLSAGVLSEMYHAAQDVGLVANHQDSTYLAGLLAKHREIVEEFPWLHMDDVSGKLSQVVSMLDHNKVPPRATAETHDPGVIFTETTALSEDAKEVRRIVSSPIDDAARKRLRIMLYQSTDSVAQLEAIGALLVVRDIRKDADMIELCDLGIRLAGQIAAPSCKAQLLAQKAVIVSDMFTMESFQYVMAARMDLVVGIPVITQQEHERARTRIEELRKQLNDLFAEAISLAQELNDPDCLARILLHVGECAGRRSFMLTGVGDAQQAIVQKKLCKESLITAKNLFAAIGEEDGVAYALHNLANQLRFFGEIDEAKELTSRVLELAEKLGNFRLKYMAEGLMTRLITGEIPDYIRGGAEIPKKI